jgi:hypothetical protein
MKVVIFSVESKSLKKYFYKKEDMNLNACCDIEIFFPSVLQWKPHLRFICGAVYLISKMRKILSGGTSLTEGSIVFNWIYYSISIRAWLRLKSTFVWVVMLCSQVEVHQHFGGAYCLHPQGQRGSHTSSQRKAGDERSVSELLPDYMASHHWR